MTFIHRVVLSTSKVQTPNAIQYSQLFTQYGNIEFKTRRLIALLLLSSGEWFSFQHLNATFQVLYQTKLQDENYKIHRYSIEFTTYLYCSIHAYNS